MQLRRFAVSLLAAAVSACGAGSPAASPQTSPEPSASAPASDEVISSRVHKMPLRDSNAPEPTSAPAGAHLTYYGGRVNSAAKVIQVLWGTGSYPGFVTGTAAPSMGSFYQQFMNGTTLASFLDGE